MPHDSTVLSPEYADRLHSLMELIEQGGSPEQANRLLDEITKLRENSLFQELGKLTREFHEALNSFRLDTRITNLAEEEFPDARERLKYVINMTAQAADRSLSAVEESNPICDELHQKAQDFAADWQRFTHRQMDAAEFRQLSGRLTDFFEELGSNTDKLRGNLYEITLAQDFQDLTGQVIKRVITLVDEMESSLVDLIRISGQNLIKGRPQEEQTAEVAMTEEELHRHKVAPMGPVVPGVDDDTTTVSGQDEVDDLLSSLGF